MVDYRPSERASSLFNELNQTRISRQEGRKHMADHINPNNKQHAELQKLEDRIVERLAQQLPHKRNWRIRLIKYGVIAVVVIAAVSYFYSCTSSSVDDSARRGAEFSRTPESPEDTVHTVYVSVSSNNQQRGCNMFSTQAAAEFAKNIAAADCKKAIELLHGKVTNATRYKNNVSVTRENTLTSGNNSEISSCALTVTDGPRLGLFLLRKQTDGGWLIVEHRNEPADCAVS